MGTQRIRTEKLFLPVTFTESELQAIGLALAAKHQEIGRLVSEKKANADSYKERIDIATSEASTLARNRVDGYESRYVDCETAFDFKKQTKRTVRKDTGEIVSEGPMTDDEMKLAQMAFDEVQKDAKEAK